MKTTEVQCSVCGKTIARPAAEVRRSLELKRRFYCSLSCCGKSNVGNLPKPTAASAAHLKKGRDTDHFSPFRYHLKSARCHSKQRDQECTITLEELKDLWDEQNGTCPFTGWKLINPSSTSWNAELLPNTASLDRINNEIGYVKGNVRFVAVMANFSRNKFSDEDVLNFCKAVVEHRGLRQTADLERIHTEKTLT